MNKVVEFFKANGLVILSGVLAIATLGVNMARTQENNEKIIEASAKKAAEILSNESNSESE